MSLFCLFFIVYVSVTSDVMFLHIYTYIEENKKFRIAQSRPLEITSFIRSDKSLSSRHELMLTTKGEANECADGNIELEKTRVCSTILTKH